MDLVAKSTSVAHFCVNELLPIGRLQKVSVPNGPTSKKMADSRKVFFWNDLNPGRGASAKVEKLGGRSCDPCFVDGFVVCDVEPSAGYVHRVRSRWRRDRRRRNRLRRCSA